MPVLLTAGGISTAPGLNSAWSRRGEYSHLRHPQYTELFLIVFGKEILHWPAVESAESLLRTENKGKSMIRNSRGRLENEKQNFS
jgi:hypothetical protein